MTSKTRRPASATAELRERIRTEGAQAGFQALLEVCRDPRAPAQAKSTAGTTLLRCGGYMEKNDDDLDDKPLEEMSFDELQTVILRGAKAAGAPDELVDAVANLSSAAPAATAAPAPPAEPAPARRRRRTAAEAGKPATGAGSPLDEFG